MVQRVRSIVIADPEFRRMLSVKSLVAEASETIAKVDGATEREQSGLGSSFEQVPRLGDPTTEWEGQYDGPNTRRGRVRPGGRGETSRPTARYGGRETAGLKVNVTL